MPTEIVGNPCVLNTIEDIAQVDIIVGDSSNWAILPVGPVERVCSYFECFSIPLYECLFIRLWM